MRVHFGLENLPSFTRPVVTIGAFDGVHHGHRTIIQRLIDKATSIQGESVIITFDPHPRQVVFPNDKSLRLLNTLDEKIELLNETGLDHLIVLPFTIEFSQINPYDYVDKILIEKIAASHLIIGYDHRFGLNREGNIDLLNIYAKQGAFEVEEIAEQDIDQLHVSSTAIRNYITEGEIEKANKLLTRPFMLSGKVQHGEKVARELGFPTANCDVDTKLKVIPAPGTYAARATCEGRSYNGMLYIGMSKTLSSKGVLSVEINLFDLVETPLYGKAIVIEPLKHVRKDQKFDSREELMYNIIQDKVDCELYFDLKNSAHRVTSAVLNYNGAAHLRKYLPSVMATTNTDHGVSLIDNASTDESIAIAKGLSEKVTIISLPQNVGFAAGYTDSMCQIKSPYVAVINSDVEVTKSWLTPLIDALDRDTSLAAVQPKILSDAQRDTFEYAGASGGLIDGLGYPFCRGRVLDNVESDQGQHDNPIEVAWTSGAAMVCRTSLFRQAGGFDRDFFAHMEEIDLCWRWRRAGYTLKCIPTSVVYHLGGGTLNYQSRRKAYLNLRNNYWMLLKNEAIGRLLFILPLRVIIDTSYAISKLFKGRMVESTGILSGMVAGLSKIISVGPKRRNINNYIKRYGIGNINNSGTLSSALVLKLLAGKKEYSQLKNDITG